MLTVTVTNATYRGEDVVGTFDLVQDFTAFTGDPNTRRNGRKGLGFIKVMPAGEQLVRLAPNKDKPVKLTVEADGVGYTVFDDSEPLRVMFPGCGRSETFTPEFGVDVERELSEDDSLPGVPLATPFVPELVETEGELTDALTELRAQFEAATGRERDNLRKRLRRAEAKVAG